MTRAPIAPLACFLVALLLPAGSRAETLHLDFRYELTWHGVVVYQMETTGEIGSDSYHLAYSGTTLGLFDLLIAYESQGEVTGRLTPEAAQPARYRLDARWHGERRHVSLDYGKNGAMAVDVVPDPKDDGLDPVPVPMREGTVDPLSAAMLVGVVGARQGGDPCHTTLHVYDGRQRYDMHLVNIGHDTLPKLSYAAYAGDAIKCRITVDRIAGFRYKSFAEPQRPPSVIWLARFDDGKVLLPVRLSTETGLGDVRGFATMIRIEETSKDAGKKK